MKKTVLIISILIVSFVSGVLFMGYLSSKAGETFIDIIKVNYIHEQEILAIHAKNSGNVNKAIRHYYNMIDAKELLHTFDIKENPWNLFFPFQAIALRSLGNTPRQRGMEIDIGISHGKLAYALEMTGFNEEAENEYKRASILTHMSPEKVKKFIEDLKDHETEMLKLEKRKE